MKKPLPRKVVSPKTRRGRPARDAIDAARTIAWFYAVAEVSQLHLRGLDRQFGSGTTGAWTKYRYGQLSPSPERLAVVEEAYPGTRRYFESPLWRLIRPGTLGQIAPRGAFEWLPLPMRARFVLPNSHEETVFWRRQGALEQDIDFLLAEAEKPGQSIDAGTASLALLHEAVLMQDKVRFRACFIAWLRYLERRREHLIMLHVPGRIFDAHWKYVLDYVAESASLLSAQDMKILSRLQRDAR